MKIVTLKQAVPNSGHLRITGVDSSNLRVLHPEFIGALGIKGTGTFG